MNYQSFWSQLSRHYPKSHGELRLPIATGLQHLDLDIPKLLSDLRGISEKMMDTMDFSELKLNAEENLQGDIVPLFEWKFTGVIRLDCMIDTNNQPKIIEINADYPDGLLMHDATYSLLLWKEVSINRDLFERFFEKNETIFILYQKDSFFLDAYCTEYLFLKEKGYRVHIGNPEDLSFRDGGLFFENIRIDVIRRCMETSKFTPEMIRNFQKGKVRFINTFDIRVLGYKNLLRSVNHPLVPLTRSLDSASLEYALSNREGLVLKPSNLYEWKGVYIGKDVLAAEWEKLIRLHLEENYIVQEFVESKKISMDFFDNDTVETRDVYFDFCPHFFVEDGKVIGDGLILSRFSEDKILNVSRGGGIGYVHFQE